MTEEGKRIRRAMTLTRALLLSALEDPVAMLEMTFTDITPEDVEKKVCSLLEYIEDTTPKEVKP